MVTPPHIQETASFALQVCGLIYSGISNEMRNASTCVHFLGY